MMLDPRQYGFLFKVENLNYFFSSYWLNKRYRAGDFVVLNKDTIWKVFIGKEERRKLSIEGLNMFESGLSDFFKMTKKIKSEGLKIYSKLEDIDLSKLSRKQLEKEFSSLMNYLLRLWETFFYTEYFMHDEVYRRIKELGIESSSLVSSPLEIVTKRERYERLKLSLNPTKEAIAEHAEQYGFINYISGGKTLTPEMLTKELKFKDPAKEVEMLWQTHERIIKERKDHPMAKAVREMAEEKFILRAFINKIWLGNTIIEKFFHEINMGARELYNLHYKEIIKIMRGEHVEIPDRTTFVLTKKNNWKPIIGNEAISIINDFEQIRDIKTGEIHGLGNNGRYVGRVKLVRFSAKTDFNKELIEMKKGDVLVSGSTEPEMILLCHKAGAIVTDEGGICSHAAIISRELGIPSVIATKIATDVLKDGDIVEVDGEKGVVKKL